MVEFPAHTIYRFLIVPKNIFHALLHENKRHLSIEHIKGH